MKSHIVVLATIALLLGGCTVVDKKISMDAAGAVAKAMAANTPASLARVPCYVAIGDLTTVPVNGILSLYETEQEGQELSQGVCSPVIAGVAIQVIQRTPFVGSAIP